MNEMMGSLHQQAPALAELVVSVGQHSDKGRKETNQDFHGALIPERPFLTLKGIAVAIADGISTSAVSRVAAETAVKSFLTDYYCTAETWPVKIAARRVIAATNSWLHAQTRRGPHPEDPDRGYVCTLSVLVLKSRSAHIFHMGDSRIARLVGRSLEPLTVDHRITTAEHSYLARALGIGPNIEIDYRVVPTQPGDIFVLSTDGVHEHVAGSDIADAVLRCSGNLDAAARQICELALDRGSTDNVTLQLVRVDNLPAGEVSDFLDPTAGLPLPPALGPGDTIDGMTVLAQLHGNARSSVYLVEDQAGTKLVLKAPAPEMAGNSAYLRRFAMEEWIGRRIDNPHVVHTPPQIGHRSVLYLLTEHVDGQTLTRWMAQNPQPALAQVRDIVEQIAMGMMAFHRLAMVHQDLRPDNIMIGSDGRVTIIDLGSASVAGVTELAVGWNEDPLPGAIQYTAPECFLGETASERSDQFSLGVTAYQLLSGRLPYDAEAARVQRRSDLHRLRYQPVGDSIPAWVDRALAKAVHPDPEQRYKALSEFIYDLVHPNPEFLQAPTRQRGVEQQLMIWQLVSAVLGLATLVLFAMVTLN